MEGLLGERVRRRSGWGVEAWNRGTVEAWRGVTNEGSGSPAVPPERGERIARGATSRGLSVSEKAGPSLSSRLRPSVKVSPSS